MARSGSPYSTPRDANRVPLLVAASTVDGVTPVVLEADPSTHQLQVSSSGGGGGSDVQYTDGASAVAHPIGTIPVFNNAGTITAVSAANPLPVNASVTVTGVATAVKQSDGSQKTQIVDGSGNVIASTSNALNTSTNITNSSLPVTGTFFQATQPVSASSLPLPTGAATSANQSTEISSLATVAALSKAEDAPHTSGDTGVPMWAVRNDTGAVFAGSDGDYIPFATDATGALRVDLNGTISTNNSTTSVLSANAVFTGTSEDALNYNEIRISVIASHVSATDGLSIQQSEDNTNWDFTDTYTIPAATGKTYSIPRQARYFRVVYTNGATLQTSFRLQTIMNRLGARVSSQRPNDAYSNETDLEQTQSFLMGYNGATWDRLRTTGTGVLTTSTVLTAGAAAIGSITNTSFIATQATAANLNATVVGTGTFATQPTIQTGTNSIGKISDITTSVVPGTAATNLGKAEDAAHTSGDTGIFALGVRNDTLADTTNTNADYAQLSTDIKGRVIVAGAPRSLKGIQQTSVSNTTSETTIITAVASTFLDVYGLILANTGASTTKVTIKDATAGTTRAVIEVPTLETRGFMLPVDSAIPQSAVNNNWTVTCGTATTALEVTAMYVKMV